MIDNIVFDTKAFLLETSATAYGFTSSNHSTNNEIYNTSYMVLELAKPYEISSVFVS